jgi:hypothetical protein
MNRERTRIRRESAVGGEGNDFDLPIASFLLLRNLFRVQSRPFAVAIFYLRTSVSICG